MTYEDLVDIFGTEDDSTSILVAVNEMTDLYQEYEQYVISYTIDGECVLIEQQFMDKVLVALDTNDLNQFTAEERETWYEFVGFEDAMSWSADEEDADNQATGATNEMPDGYGYVRTAIGITEERAIPPLTSYPNTKVASAIDRELMRLLDCDTTNACGILEGELYNPAPCPL